MFWFGESKNSDFDWKSDDAWKVLPGKRREFARTNLDDILNLLDKFSNESFEDALPELTKESGFSDDETRKTLSLLPGLLKRESLEKRIAAEFTRKEVLDNFIKLPGGSFKVKAVPRGLLLHVTAGNVFLSSIDSLIMGFVTKNLSLLKVSSQNRFFPEYFAKKLLAFDTRSILSDKFAILHWKGGETDTETFVKKKVNAIVAWGGEEMITSYHQNLPSHIKFLDFGPKISIQVITREGLEKKSIEQVASHIVSDIVPWDQSACASPQNLYIEDGLDEQKLVSAIDKAFLMAPLRGHIDADEAVEILKEKYRGYYSELMEGGALKEGDQHLLHLEKNQLLKPSPLHRSLIIKKFSSIDELRDILEPFSYYLQSCSYLVSEQERPGFLSELSLTGIKRFAPLGTITFGMEGAPHDGRFVLRELVTFIGDEIRSVDYGEDFHDTHDSSTLKTHFEKGNHPKGYIFSSGGTTGEPKYLHFSYEEFDFMSDMLADNFKRQGIQPGMTVANLFVAGNLWSSFLCVEKALEKIGAIQLPIGGMCSSENILLYLKKFKPDVVMGIPSMLVMNAEFMLSKNEDFNIPMIFYAGEALSDARKSFLSNVWKTKFFGSAGYASVDAGVIGYQCTHCLPGEHHLFSEFINMHVVDGEGVVTSIARDTMPVKNYRTGDRIEWISACTCGRPDKRFKLLGRIDNVIQIWSCRLLTADVEKSLSEKGILTFQIKISERTEETGIRELLTINYEEVHSLANHEELLLDIYNRSRDVKDTIEFIGFKKNVELVPVKTIARNARTGKISTVIDLRK